MGFLVQLAPYAFAEERRSFVAERGGEVVAFLSAVPVYARNGWFVEHLLRGREAPNGTTELLVDAAMRAAVEAGRDYVTLGLAPLAGEVAGWLRGARLLGQPLYDFEGLWAFKRKLRPHRWERLHLAWPGPARTPWPVYDALEAFARGSLLRFGVASLLRRPVLWVGLLALLLVPWTVLLSLPAHAHRFPAPWVRWGWVLFDVGLTGALFTLVRRWRPGLATVLGSVIAGDACLTLLQAVLYNAPRARVPLDWFIICLAVLAPASASGLLFWAREHPTLEPG